MRVSVNKLSPFLKRIMPCLTTAFRIGWGLSTWLLYVAVKFELLMVLRWYCVNTLESYNFIDVYIIWATLEALFLPFRIQFTTKRCQNALMYKKIFIFLNQMILNLFTTIWLTSKDPKTSFGTCGLRGGRVRRGFNGRLVTHIWCGYVFQRPFLKSLRVSFNHSPLSAYKLKWEATVFGLTEIQDNRFICFHRIISQNSFVFFLTCLITLLD